MFISLLRERRSIRKFDNRPVEEEKVRILIEAALRSPSSMGSNPWEFIVVRDKALLKELSSAKPHGSTFLKNAPLGVVICADPAKSSVWVEDASIASILLHLTAQSLGLGSCWIQIRERMHDPDQSSEQYIAHLLGIPDGLKVESIMAIGYPAEKKPSHPVGSLQFEKVHLNTYGSPFPS